MMYGTVGSLALLFAVAASPAAPQSTALGPQGCVALRTLQLPGIALSEIMAEWVPAGPASPDAVIASRPSAPRLTRPLCAYPRYAHYTGRGDPQLASSFECRAP